MPKHLRLISHKLCPYVQRAVIVATEKGIEFERVDIDLAAKPDWFLALSPTGKVPVLEVTEADGSRHILFESAVIAEYLDELSEPRLLPADPLARARERAWVEFASATLADVGRLYTAPTARSFDEAVETLEGRFGQLERAYRGPWFSGPDFGLVDAALGPAFRYLRLFGLDLFGNAPRVREWSELLLTRPSVAEAVGDDYADRLIAFVLAKKSHLAGLLAQRLPEAA